MPIPPVHSNPYQKMENSLFLSLLQRTINPEKKSKPGRRGGGGGSGGGLFKMFKLLPMLTTGCKMVALLGRPRKNLLTDRATTVTLFGYRRGRVSIAIQEDPHRLPVFVMELPMLISALHKEMTNDVVRLALECDAAQKKSKRKILEEFVWAVFCNGRKVGYSIRRTDMSDDEAHVIKLLRGVSIGAGVLPAPDDKESAADGELTYIRARFERAVGSKDSESLYMINPDEASGQELSIFFVRMR